LARLAHVVLSNFVEAFVTTFVVPTVKLVLAGHPLTGTSTITPTLVNESRFGVGDITGRGSIEFWTQSKKMTTKWNREAGTNWMS